MRKEPAAAELTYAEHGATRGAMPAGYHHVEHTARVGTGTEAFERAAQALMSWRVHRGAGFRVAADGDAAPGEVVTMRAMATTIPCRVVYVVREAGRRGFAVGTLPGHPVSGEEAFIVEIAADGGVRFTVRSFSRPARALARAAGPAGPVIQRLIAGRYARSCRRLARQGSRHV
jgi:uncharacterized protein (UPF0548 family)